LLLCAFGVVGLVLFIRPALVGVDVGSASQYQNNPIWLACGVVFVVLGVVFQSIAYRWPRRLLHVLRTQQPTPMRIKVDVEQNSDSTQYFATLASKDDGDCAEHWRVRLWAPSQEVQGLVGHELSGTVYFDPQTAMPVIIEYRDVLLWAMKGAASRLTASAPRADA
jgi:hypothetical protein